MLRRKFEKNIEEFLTMEKSKILLVNGARQIGKSFLIRYVGKKLFKNYVEINLKEDSESVRIFEKVRSTQDFYMQLGVIAGKKLGKKEDTLVFLDEIQSYPHLFTMLKFLNQESRYTYVASGSQLGVALSQTASVPIGSVEIQEMYPLDFEEFLWAMGCGEEAIGSMRQYFLDCKPLQDSLHEFMLKQFKTYLLVGGLPEAINVFLSTRNIAAVRKVQTTIQNLYRIDASQYDEANKLVIRRIYDLIPSNLENKKKRVVVKNIEETKGHKQFSDYANEFEYLIHSGIALSVQSISDPRFPLLASVRKNLLKLYINDVGLLTNILYGNNVNAILQDEKSVNLGAVYESVVAQELQAHGHKLYYYDNKKKGEVDFLVDDYNTLSILPLEIKSGKDYRSHRSLDKFLAESHYDIRRAIVFSNERDVSEKNSVVYMPVYYAMFLGQPDEADSQLLFEPVLPPVLTQE